MDSPRSVGIAVHRRRLCAALLAVVVLAPTAARAAAVSASDAKRVREVIEAQLAAFAADDARRAFSYATPELRAQIGTPERFIAMVRSSYAVVYRPASVVFLAPERRRDEVLQAVRLTDDAGRGWLALYHLQRQRDRSWRVAGCELAQSEGRS